MPNGLVKFFPGNDIVDLKDAESRLSLYRSRVKERVFSPDELTFLASSENPHTWAWYFWAKKEAAFKSLSRAEPGIPFRWKSFEAHPEGGVVYNGYTFPCTLEISSDYVHATSPGSGIFSEHGGRALSAVELLDTILPQVGSPEARTGRVKRERESQGVRQLAKQLVYDRTGIVVEHDEDAKGFPVLIGREGGEIIPVSYSHHGRYIAVFLFVSAE